MSINAFIPDLDINISLIKLENGNFQMFKQDNPSFPAHIGYGDKLRVVVNNELITLISERDTMSFRTFRML